jgi:hypothetical protein
MACTYDAYETEPVYADDDQRAYAQGDLPWTIDTPG